MFHIDLHVHTFLHPLSHLIRAWKGKWSRVWQQHVLSWALWRIVPNGKWNSCEGPARSPQVAGHLPAQAQQCLAGCGGPAALESRGLARAHPGRAALWRMVLLELQRLHEALWSPHVCSLGFVFLEQKNERLKWSNAFPPSLTATF